MRRNLLKEPAFLLAIWAAFFALQQWFYLAKGGGEGMMTFSLELLSFLEPASDILYEIGYIICSIGLVVIFVWLLYLAGVSIYKRIKHIEDISPELKAIKDLTSNINKLIQHNEGQSVVRRHSIRRRR